MFFFLESIFRGNPGDSLRRSSWKMRQSLSEKVVTPTDLKSSPGFFFPFLFFADLQKMRKNLEKEGDKGRTGEMQVLLSETASAAPSLPA